MTIQEGEGKGAGPRIRAENQPGCAERWSRSRIASH
jgi:hypothetical protein